MLHNNALSKRLSEIDELLIKCKGPEEKNNILLEKAYLLSKNKHINDAIDILNSIITSSQNDNKVLISAYVDLVYCYHKICDEEGILKTIKSIPQQYQN